MTWPIWILKAVGFARKIPPQIWIAMALIALYSASLAWYGSKRYDAGAASVQSKWDAANAKDAEAVREVEKQSTQIVEKVVTKYVDRVQVIREKGKEIIRNVYVTIPADACPIDGNFRVLHDAAARMPTEPAPWRVPDYASAPVEVRTAAATVAGNYNTCHENAATLIAWQEWYRKNAAIR